MHQLKPPTHAYRLRICLYSVCTSTQVYLCRQVPVTLWTGCLTKPWLLADWREVIISKPINQPDRRRYNRKRRLSTPEIQQPYMYMYTLNNFCFVSYDQKYKIDVLLCLHTVRHSLLTQCSPRDDPIGVLKSRETVLPDIPRLGRVGGWAIGL